MRSVSSEHLHWEDKTVTEIDKRVSDQLVRLVQIIFGFVLAQSLGRYDAVVLDPFAPEHRLQALALLGVYITTVLSWIDWHVTMARRPYNFNPKAGKRLTEEMRLLADLFIVSAYAFLLLSVTEVGSPRLADPTRYLVGYVAVFFGYVLSGVLRRISYGPVASALGPIILFLLLDASALGLYEAEGETNEPWHSWLAVLAPIMLMVSYRLTRRYLRNKRQSIKQQGLRIGFDVDGVLANQIAGVLPRIKRRLGFDLSYEDVTDWRLPLGDSDIAKEILSAMADPDYIMNMPVHTDARLVLDKLYPKHIVKVLTARPPEAEQWTESWLDKNALNHDGVASVREKEKSLFATDVLIDDYIGNIEEYLSSTNGTAVLVDQPWNRGRDALQHYLDEGRLYVVTTVTEVPGVVERVHELERERSQARL